MAYHLVMTYWQPICHYADYYKLGRELVAGVIEAESGGRLDARGIGPWYAAGLMQVVPCEYWVNCGAPDARPTSQALRSDASLNLEWGCGILRSCLDHFGAQGRHSNELPVDLIMRALNECYCSACYGGLPWLPPPPPPEGFQNPAATWS